MKRLLALCLSLAIASQAQAAGIRQTAVLLAPQIVAPSANPASAGIYCKGSREVIFLVTARSLGDSVALNAPTLGAQWAQFDSSASYMSATNIGNAIQPGV